MLSLQDLALVKLSEELSELSHACAKALQFGLDSVDPNTGLSTREALNLEFNDVFATAAFVNNVFNEDLFNPDPEMLLNKVKKIKSYIPKSVECGRVEVN